MSGATSPPRLGAPDGARARPLPGFRAGRAHLLVLGLAVVALPVLLPAGPGNTAPVDALALAYLLVALVGAARRGRAIQRPAGGALLLMLGAAVVATLASQDVGLGVLTVVVEAYLVLLLFGVANDLADDPRALRLVMAVWVLAAAAWTILPVGGALHLLPQELPVVGVQGSRPYGTTGNPNLLGSYLVTSFFVLLASPWPRARPLRLLLGGWLLWGVWLTGSNGGLAGLLVGFAALGVGALLRRSRTREQVFGLVGGLLLLGVALLAGGATLLQWGAGRSPIRMVSEQTAGGPLGNTVGRADHGLQDRLQIWQQVWDEASPNVVLGIGPGQLASLDVHSRSGVTRTSVHNDYLSALIERGLLGLVAYLALCAALLRWCGRLLVAGGGGRAGHRALAAAVWANLVFGMAHETYHFRHVWMLFALVWVAAHQLEAAGEGALAGAAPEPRPATA
ncbi:MAG TPA: O-antigen ligase family protein [Actinomycetota bacterium]